MFGFGDEDITLDTEGLNGEPSAAAALKMSVDRSCWEGNERGREVLRKLTRGAPSEQLHTERNKAVGIRARTAFQIKSG